MVLIFSIGGYDMENSKILKELNEKWYSDLRTHKYHMAHLELFKRYAFEINLRLGHPFQEEDLATIAYAHDLFKDDNPKVKYTNHGEDILVTKESIQKKYGNSIEYFGFKKKEKSVLSEHAKCAALFVMNCEELSDYNKDILYPIIFHSLPILRVYQDLTQEIQLMVDITVVVDKCSSNYLKIQQYVPCYFRMEDILFGADGKEFNFSAALFAARLIGSEKYSDEVNKDINTFYLNRLNRINPFIMDKIHIKEYGRKKIWERKPSILLRKE